MSAVRRRLLGWLTTGFLSLWFFGFAWVVAAFLRPPRSRRSLAERLIEVGPTDSIPVGQAQLVRHGREPIFVIRTDQKTWIGLSAVCTHLHCVLQWPQSGNGLSCPCHAGAFDLNGNAIKGPPRLPLKRYRVENQLGVLYVHL